MPSSDSDEKHHSHHEKHHHHHKHHDKHKRKHRHSPRRERRHSSSSSKSRSCERKPHDPVPQPQPQPRPSPNPEPLPPPPDPDNPSNGPHSGPEPESDSECFDPEPVAVRLYKAMKGLGTDEKTIIKELTSHTNNQIQLVKEKYLKMYGQTLKEDLKSDLSFNFKEVCVGLLEPKIEYEAHKLKNAIKGLGTDEMCVIDILCTKDGNEINKLKETYKKLYNSDLESDLSNEESGPLGNIFRSLAIDGRPSDSNVDIELAKNEAQMIYEAREGFLGTDENAICRILVTRSFAQLRETFDQYARISEYDIENVIKREVSGKLKKALIAIIQCSRNKPAYFARRLYKTMDGLGTNDEDLIRIILSRSEIDMSQIKSEFYKLYNQDLCERIKKDLSGHYKKIVVLLASKS